MVKHTQIIRRVLPTNCLSVFHCFVGLAVKGLNYMQQQDIFSKELAIFCKWCVITDSHALKQQRSIQVNLLFVGIWT